MVTLRTIRPLGDQLVALFDDGSRAVAYPTGNGIWKVRAGTSGTDPAPPGGTDPNPPAGTAPGSGAAAVDDYPWPNATINTMSPLRYGYRECVDFVAWRLNRDAGCVAAPWKYDWGNLRLTNGDAIGWRHDWDLHGWGIDIHPVAGCIGWYGSSAGAYGHVNYVRSVNADGTLNIEEYNWGGMHKYGTRVVTPGGSGAPDSYLSAPPR